MTTRARRCIQSNYVSETNALFPSDKLPRKRSLAIKRLAEASAALDAHLKIWTPDFFDNVIISDQMSVLIGTTMAREELEYALGIALNEVVYIDDEEMGDNCSKVFIEHI